MIFSYVYHFTGVLLYILKTFTLIYSKHSNYTFKLDVF